MKRLVSAFACVLALGVAMPAQDAAKPGAETKPANFTTTDGYPIDTCIVSDEPLDGSIKTFKVDGHTFKTCCNKCKAKVEKDPKSYIAQKEKAVIAAQSATYALTTCPISGKALGDKAVSVVVDNTLVKLCCPNCEDKLTSDPAPAIAKVQQAAFARQSADYAATKCPVSGHDLDASAVPVMHGTTLVKLCCEDCMTKLSAHANEMAAKVAAKADAKDAKGDKSGDAKREKSGGNAPMANAVPSDQGGACCETGKAESGCCQAGAKGEAKPAAGGCCEAAKKEATPECCESKAGKTEQPKKID